MIYHIYWGTRGNSGLYLDEIYQCLKRGGYNQKLFVSYYYPFEYGEKIFFRYSDLAYCKVKGFWRKIIQVYEILLAFGRILFAAKNDKPQVVNYSLITGSYGFIVVFLKLLRSISGCKLVITCHDVLPFGNNNRYASEMKNRRLLFTMADYLLVHNDSSIHDLENNFSIDRKKVVKHLFPLMDLTKINSINKREKNIDFLFIGHLRKEKGVDFLIRAWATYYEYNKKATLWICGKPYGQNLDVDSLKKQNIFCNLGYISEDDYCRYIQSARYVILPYIKGTNSGIISTVLSLGANVITSDIPMFLNNPLVSQEDMFKVEDVKSFVEILEHKYSLNTDNFIKEKLVKYRKNFEEEVLNVYKTINQ